MGVNHPRQGDKSARGWISQRAKKLEGEQARGRNGKGAKWQSGKKARHRIER